MRAVAIVLVVSSHLGIKGTAGGFVGVDIFFVISGYLLTGNIARAIAAGTFSVGGFYERRIRRIAPALLVMLAATSVLAFLVFSATALVLFGRSLLAATFSYSNFYFLTQSGYFSVTFTKLLLHTWSLGVEEQFYLVLPLCMLWSSRGPSRTTRAVVAVLGVASFAVASVLTIADRSLAFYMPYSRAWELLLGSALALGMVPSPANRAIREILAAIGISIVLFCAVAYDETTPFPGLGALPPCVAAALAISLGERGRTTLTSFLFWPPVVFIGAISYSLYLWHWPVILFFRLGIVPNFGVPHALTIASIVVATALAILSWRYVELPFRTGRWQRLPRARVFAAAGAGAAVLGALAVAFVAARGLPDRFPATANAVGDYLFGDSTKRPECFVDESFARFDPQRCLAGRAGKRNVLLFGDSHADALWSSLDRALPDANVLQATGSACPPIEGRYDRSPCGMLRRFIYERYLPNHRVDDVILTERWTSVADLAALEPALRWFRDRRIATIVIGPVPEYSGPLPILLALEQKWRAPALAHDRLVRRIGQLDRELAERLRNRPGVRYASAWRALCPAGRCREYVDARHEIPTLFDENHVTPEGGLLAVRRMQDAGAIPR